MIEIIVTFLVVSIYIYWGNLGT